MGRGPYGAHRGHPLASPSFLRRVTRRRNLPETLVFENRPIDERDPSARVRGRTSAGPGPQNGVRRFTPSIKQAASGSSPTRSPARTPSARNCGRPSTTSAKATPSSSRRSTGSAAPSRTSSPSCPACASAASASPRRTMRSIPPPRASACCSMTKDQGAAGSRRAGCRCTPSCPGAPRSEGTACGVTPEMRAPGRAGSYWWRGRGDDPARRPTGPGQGRFGGPC